MKNRIAIALAHRFTRFLLGAVLPFFLYWIAKFSVIQSLVLSIFCWLFAARFMWVRQYLAARELFRPFEVQVVPKWDAIVRDYKVVNDDQLQMLLQRAKSDPARYKVLTSGFVFTVLNPSPGYIDFRGLVYANGAFRHSVDFHEDAEFFAVLAHSVPRLLERPLTAFMKWGIDGGFDLGIEVNDKWWDSFCHAAEATALTKVKADRQPYLGRMRLALAILPYSAFTMYQGEEGYTFEKSQRDGQERDATLTKFGWSYHEGDDRDRLRSAITGIESQNQIHHKYFTVYHRVIQ